MADQVQAVEHDDSPENEVSLPDNISTDAVLSSIFNGDEVDLPAEEKAPDTKADDAATVSTTVDPAITALNEKLEAQQAKLIELETTNNILRHQAQQPRQVETPPTPEPEFDFGKFREAVSKDPAQAIYDLFQRAQKGTATATAEATKQAADVAMGLMGRQQAHDSDRATTVAEFGELFNSNKQFGALANQIYNQLVADAPMFQSQGGPIKYRNGAMYQAAAIAYAQMHKAGQLQTNPKVVRLNERRPAPTNPVIGDTGEDKPRTIASDIPAKDLAVMARTAKGLGMSLERYLTVFEGLKKRDPHYAG